MRVRQYGRIMLLVASIAALSGIAVGQGAGGLMKHPLTDMPPEGNVQTTYFLPEHPSKEFPAGDFIPIVLGFHNEASRPYNVSFIMGSLNLPQEFSYHIQNFTAIPFWQVVKSKEEASLQYKFRPDQSLSPMELRVALTVFYQDNQGTGYSSTFFNETIDIIERPRAFDYEAFVMLMIMAAILGLAGYGVLSWVGSMAGMKKPSKKPTASTAGETTRDEWLQGTPYSQSKKSKEKSKTRPAQQEGKKTM